MFQSTATVTSIFSVSRSRPVERWVSMRAVSWMLVHAADPQAAIEHRQIVGQALHVTREQDDVVGVGRAVAGPQLPDDEAGDGRDEQRSSPRRSAHKAIFFPSDAASTPCRAAARPRGPWKYSRTQG